MEKTPLLRVIVASNLTRQRELKVTRSKKLSSKAITMAKKMPLRKRASARTVIREPAVETTSK